MNNDNNNPEDGISDDMDTFAAFYDDYLPQIYRYVQYRVGDTATAEDLTSTIFENALRAWPKRRKHNALKAWIFRIAKNAVISHYRRNGRRNEVSLNTASEAGPYVEQCDPETYVLHTERQLAIHAAMRTLSHREQHIIGLKFGCELSNRAIAPILGVSESNVAVILFRALRKMWARLSTEPEK